MQSSCNPRSLIHNSGCSSHWRPGGGGGGRHWFLCPQAWLECSWTEGVGQGAGELCLSLPPRPFSFSPRVGRSPPHPCFSGLFPLSPSLQACGLFSLQDHSPTPSPQFANPWQRLGQDAQGIRAGRGHLSGHQSKALPAQATPSKAREEKAQFLTESLTSASNSLLEASCHLPLLYGLRKAPSRCPHPLCSPLPLFSPLF